MEGLLNGNLLSRASIFGASGSNIKSIQSGMEQLVSDNVNVTIASVNVNKSIILIFVSFGDDSATIQDLCVAPEFLNNTTINLKRHRGTIDNARATWTVIEFNEVKSIQTGTVLINKSYDTSAEDLTTVTVSRVDISKSILLTYAISSYTDSTACRALTRGRIVNATTIGFETRYTNQNTAYWQLVEFK